MDSVYSVRKKLRGSDVMDTEYAIEVSHVYKHFSGRVGTTLKDQVVYFRKRNKRYKHDVLKDISFNVKKGEAIAIIGRNGSGKSTILKLLTRILRPNSGTITINGKTSCLIELGAGFHPDMTGRENVYINASIFGLTNKQIDSKMDDILNFSEIGEFIDERVRNYSSGMFLRLAFAIAINVQTEILIIDEILSVGDIQFSKKCMDKLEELKKNGTSIVLVTHSIEQAKKFCDRVIWINNGVIAEEGDPEKVCNSYVEFMNTRGEQHEC